ncbi:MAG: cytochrome c3 family protein [Desulfovibrio sp.]|nr:cytochrome c3 family protein [Desulfovibrio sp.]
MHTKITKFCLFCFVFTFCFLTSSNSKSVEPAEVFLINHPVQADHKMPLVKFNHTKHVAFVDQGGGDCSRCHRMNSKGFQLHVFDVDSVQQKKQVAYLHDMCTACHKTSGAGPLLVNCRSCHVQEKTN